MLWFLTPYTCSPSTLPRAAFCYWPEWFPEFPVVDLLQKSCKVLQKATHKHIHAENGLGPEGSSPKRGVGWNLQLVCGAHGCPDRSSFPAKPSLINEVSSDPEPLALMD